MTSRKGSALLVVLGMLSFMLFSGLAFSVYMRYSRLPTSFLRRTSTTRQLTKAAVAEAINDIDSAIGDNPHPGIGNLNSNQNYWNHRVFMGDSNSHDDVDSDTVSVIPLEGLAYLPPCLINEARYYSRCTPTATWKPFWFDSGRYAYVAIDVSDYFDVNRMISKLPRASGANRRLGFAYIFEDIDNGDHKDVGDPDSWDQFMQGKAAAREVDDNGNITFNSNAPFISMADFNCSMAGEDIGGLKNPFWNFINKGDAYDGASGEVDEDHNLFTEDEAQRYGMMTFVANGYFPKESDETSSSNSEGPYSLDDSANQPFERSVLEKTSHPDLETISDYFFESGSKSWKVAGSGQGDGRLNMPNVAALWDYLDSDSVPCSVCLPTVERTPMICGVNPQFGNGGAGVKVEVKFTQSPSKGTKTGDSKVDTITIDNEQWDRYSREITYTLDIDAINDALESVNVSLLYPFKEYGLTDWTDLTYDYDGRVAFFFTENGKSMGIRPSGFKSYLQKKDIGDGVVLDQSVICLPLKRNDDSIKPENIIGKNAEDSGSLPCKMYRMEAGTQKPNASDLLIAKIKYTWPRDKYVDDGNGNLTPQTVNPDPITGGNTTVEVTQEGLGYLSDTGAFTSIKEKLQKQQPINLDLNVAVWVRLIDGDKNTVDLVPACHRDDANVADNKNSDNDCARYVSGGSTGYPLLRARFSEGAANEVVKMGVDSLLSDSDVLGELTAPTVEWLIADPRYNYAPENWVKKTLTAAISDEDWSKDQDIQGMISKGDGDCYMAVSDAGYLQSIYELAYLPRVSEGFDAGNKRGEMEYGKLSRNFNFTDYPTSCSQAKDAGNMWKTYNPFGKYGSDFDDLRDLVESGDGMKVNPYARSTDVLMAAFANTPLDWRCAGTNEDFSPVPSNARKSAKDFNPKYAWNGLGQKGTGKGMICWDCLAEFAEKFQTAMNGATKVDSWLDIYDDLGWDTTDKKKIVSTMDSLDQDDSNIYSVDRKFFYGFWRECFAARQQLFLVFVRAEPMMMGGGVAGQTPPQLGAKAVAVVWRDPRANTAGNEQSSDSTTALPHRSRILFYHQFD